MSTNRLSKSRKRILYLILGSGIAIIIGLSSCLVWLTVVSRSPLFQIVVFGKLGQCGPWGQTRTITSNALPLKPIWQFTTGAPVVFGPYVSNGIVFVRTSRSDCPVSIDSDADIVALDARTGRQLWEIPTTGLLNNVPPILFQNLVLMPVDAERSLIAVDKDTGNPIWRIGAKDLFNDQIKSIANDDRLIFISLGYDPAKIEAVDPLSGKIVWEQSGPFPSQRSPSLTVYDGNVYALFFGRLFYVLDPKTGEIVQQAQTHLLSYNDPSYQDNLVFINELDSIVAVDLASMKERWEFSPSCVRPAKYWPSHSNFLYAPSVFRDMVFVAGGCRMIFALGKEEGIEKWRYSTGDAESISQFASVGDTGYVMLSDWSVRGLDLRTGLEKGRLETGPESKLWAIGWQGLASWEGRLYISFGDRTVYAFGGGE